MLSLWLTGVALALEPGTYRMHVDTRTATHMPVVGNFEVSTRSTVLIQADRDEAGRLWFTQRTCDVQIGNTAGASTIMPPALIEALPFQTYPVSDAMGRLIFDPGAGHLGVGSHVTDLARAGAADWIDVEGDGRPGATVWVDVPIFGQVEVYVAQRSHILFVGADGGTSAAGSVLWDHFEQRTLGASHAFFRRSPPVEPLGGGAFRLTRVADLAGCEQILD